MKVRLITIALALAAIGAYGQDCKPDDAASLARVRQAIRTITKQQIYTSFDDKALSRAGDTAAIAIVKELSDGELNDPKNTKSILSILHIAFGCRYCVTTPADKEPRFTTLLLEHLQANASAGMRSEIEKTREFILQQTHSHD